MNKTREAEGLLQLGIYFTLDMFQYGPGFNRLNYA